MIHRIAKIGLPALLALMATAGTSDAFGRKKATHTCTPVYCEPVCCYPWHHHHCYVYEVSPPDENLYGPASGKTHKGKMGCGMVIHVNAPGGVQFNPTGQINVIQTGPGEVKYEGYNHCALHPGLPGGTIQWSIFLCPTKAGKDTVTVGFMMSNNEVKNVKLEIEIEP